MDLGVLADLAEVLGGLGVVVSLCYLAYETRQNAKATQASTYIKVNDTMIENTCLLLGPEAAGPVFLKAMGGLGKLDVLDYSRFHMVALGMMRRYETLYVLKTLDLLEDWSTEGFKNSLVGLLTHQGIAEWWPSSSNLFSAKFGVYVTGLIEEIQNSNRQHGHGSLAFDTDEEVEQELEQALNSNG